MRKVMEFKGVHKGDAIEVSGPDADGEYRVSINELRTDNFGDLYLARDTLAEMHAFIGELLDRRRGS